MRHLVECANRQQGMDEAVIAQLKRYEESCHQEMEGLAEANNSIYSRSLGHEQYTQQLQFRLSMTETMLNDQVQMGNTLAESAEENIRQAEKHAQDQARQTLLVEDSTAQAQEAAVQASAAALRYQQQATAELQERDENERKLRQELEAQLEAGMAVSKQYAEETKVVEDIRWRLQSQEYNAQAATLAAEDAQHRQHITG